MNNFVNIFVKRSSYALMAQVISIIVSISLSFILPKYISIPDFAHWQYFLLLSSYIGILHFGFNDGIYLKIGGQSFNEINKEEWIPQILLCFGFQTIFAIAIIVVSYWFVEDPIKQQIFYYLAVYVIIENSYKILSFILMATDQLIFYSKSVIIDKIAFSIFLIFLIFGRITVSPTTVILFFILSRSVALVMLLLFFRHFYSKFWNYSYSHSFSNLLKTMTFGITLTISNLLSTFIIGSGRFFVEHYWNIEIFAKISLAVSISMFILIFISQIGLVLFPLLRNIDYEKQKIALDKGIFILGILSLISYFIYFPIYIFVGKWLPQYSESLKFMVFLFPIALYEVKFNLLFLTYFKMLNKQKKLLVINLLTVIIAVVFYWLACNLHNLNLILIVMTISISIRSLSSQLYLQNHYSLKSYSYTVIELLFSVFFIVIFNITNIKLFFAFFIISVVIILFAYKNKIREEIQYIRYSLKSR